MSGAEVLSVEFLRELLLCLIPFKTGDGNPGIALAGCGGDESCVLKVGAAGDGISRFLIDSLDDDSFADTADATHSHFLPFIST